MDVGVWLRSVGLGQYDEKFRDNKIDRDVLSRLTADDLKDIGVSAVGDRVRLLDAIRTLAGARPPTDVPASQSQPVPAKAPQISAERRHLTVMFTDLVGSTALSTTLDPEDLRRVISAYHNCVAEFVSRLGGYVAKYMGDGVLIYFGYPDAHEDDPERAVRAGLLLVEAVQALDEGQQLSVRIGIATGIVVVGDLVGSGDARERGIVGETPNLAARLQSQAPPDGIVISYGTRNLLGSLFQLEDLGFLDLKGFADPIPAFRVIRPSGIQSRFEAFRSASLPLIGRSVELAQLGVAWQRASGGTGGAVVVLAEPGMVKSRLVQALSDELASLSHSRVRLFCSPFHQDNPLFPFIEELERSSGSQRHDQPDARREQIAHFVRTTDLDPETSVPLFCALLSIPAVDDGAADQDSPLKRK